jgi:signal transduction histidine kinase
MSKYFALCVFLFSTLPGVAKTPNIKADSLKSLLHATLTDKNPTSDTITINKINKLAREYISTNPDSTLYYGRLAINRSKTIHYVKGIADGLQLTAAVDYSRGNYTIAKKNLDQAILHYRALHDGYGESDSYKIYGDLFNQTGDYQQSLGYLNKALAIKLKINDQAGIARVYLHLGNVYDNLGHPSAGLDFYLKSLSIDIKLKDKTAAAAAYNNIGLILQGMEIYPKALEYYYKSLKTFRDTKKPGGISAVTQNIGEVLIIQGDYDSAIAYLTEALNLARQLDDKDGISFVCSDLSLCYAHKGDYKKALSYSDKALQVATKARIDLNIDAAYVSYATIYNLQGNFAKAYEYSLKGRMLADKLGSLIKKSSAMQQLSISLGGLKWFSKAYEVQKAYIALKDSFKTDESIQKFTSYNLEADFAQKQQRIVLLGKEKDAELQQRIQKQMLLSVIFLVIILGMIVIVVIYYNARQKQEKINAQLEEKNKEVLLQKADIDHQAFKLNELNNLKDRLISILAHDLRAPLSTLRGLFGLLQDDSLSQEEVLEMIPQVLRKLEYTSDFLDTLLFWINSQMDNFHGAAKIFALTEIIAAECSNNFENAQSKGITLVDDVPAGLKAFADRDSIRIVIRNLITNAIKFCNRDDTISITARVYNEDNIIVSVKDTGTGISPEQLNKLFKSKVNSGTGTQNESGTGMGLLFCKDLVEKSNGTIWATSKVGQGSEFLFTLPLVQVPSNKMELA